MPPEIQFVLGTALQWEETRLIEFKEVKGPNPFASIANTADEYAVGFLNSEGGRIYWGIRDDDKVVVGVTIPEKERDRLRQDVSNKVSSIQPQLDPARFRINLHRVSNGSADLVVVELVVPAGNSTTPYYTGGNECFVRVDAVNRKLSGQQLTDWIRCRMGPPPERETVDPALQALAQRIRRIFSGHGLLPTHLARFFEIRKAPFTITLADQQNDVTFLRWLDEPKTAWIAETFGVRREWIDGEDGRIFDEQSYDKHPDKFFADISQLCDSLVYDDVSSSCEAWFLRMADSSDSQPNPDSRVVVIVRLPIANMSREVTIYRYVSDFEGYFWNKGRAAIQLRAWARLLFVSKEMICYGREVNHALAQDIWGNSVFLHEILESPRKCGHCRDDWHPEDYALYPEESGVAKPDAFFRDMIAFLQKNGLPHQPTQLFFRAPTRPS